MRNPEEKALQKKRMKIKSCTEKKKYDKSKEQSNISTHNSPSRHAHQTELSYYC